MADEIRVLNANEFHEVFKDLYEKYQDAIARKYRARKPLKKDPTEAFDFPGFHYVKWEHIERFYRDGDWNSRARYLCYFRDGTLLGVNKIYVESAAKEHINNEWREANGLPPVTGLWWGHAFLDVRGDLQRQGIGVKLFDKMLSMMSPGDLYHSRSYSEKGLPFIISWVKSRRDKIHVLVDEYSLIDYDPTKVNFSVDLRPELLKAAGRVACQYLAHKFR